MQARSLFALSSLIVAASAVSASAQNTAPFFIEVGPQDLTVGVPFTLNVTASDPDMDAMLLTVSNAPAGSGFTDRGNGRGRFSWTPGPGAAGSHTVTFHVADTGEPMMVGALDVPMAVGANVNHPPVLDPIGNQVVDVGVELALSLSAMDEDGDPLVFEAFGLPSGASLVGTEFRFTPAASQLGNHDVTFNVLDSGSPPASDSETISITVGNVNRPPVLAPIGNRSAEVGTQMQIALSASDPDTDPLLLDCAGLPGDAQFTDLLDGTGTIDWAPNAAGNSAVTCTVEDGGVPPLATGELFMMTATAPPPPAEEDPKPVLDDARWSARHRMLWVHGHWEGEADGEPVSIYGVAGDGSTFLLGTGASREGRFAIGIRPFVAPCEVTAEVDGAALAVAKAPGDCGKRLLTRAHAELSCRGDLLRVEGRRAPIGGEIALVNAATGVELARVPVDDRGHFSFEGSVGGAPRKLQLRAEVDGMTWRLAEPLTIWRQQCRWHHRWHDHHSHHGKHGRH